MVEKVQMPFGGRRKNAKKERSHVCSSVVVKVVLKITKSEKSKGRGEKAGEGPDQATERRYLLLVDFSQKFGALVMLLTKRLEVIRASVDEAFKPCVKRISVTRTVLVKNAEQCFNAVLTSGSLTVDVSSMNSVVS